MKVPNTPARALAALAIAGAVILGAWGIWEASAGARQETAARNAARDAAARQARLESIGYYRVKASYIVKNTGEHVDFDYVAACATVVTMYRDGDRSVDTPFGIAPKTFIAPTRDGHAIQVVTPDACHNEVQNGFIPPDLIPLTIFYDDVINLGFGWGYTSQDAYDNARARISFEGATVTAATYADFIAWHAKAEAEFKPFGKVRSPWGYSYEYGTGLTVARHCDFYVRAPVFAAGKPALTAEWEKRGKPEFWVFEDGSKAPEFWSAFRSRGVIINYPQPRTRQGGVGTILSYSRQRWGKVHYGRDDLFPANEVYPYLPISLSSTPPPSLDAAVFPTKVPVSDDWKGLAACGENDPRVDHVFWGGRFNRSQVGGDEGQPTGDRTRPFMVNNTMVATTHIDPPRLVFQRDEFVLTNQSNTIEGIIP